MPEITVPWGQDNLSFEIPEAWNLIQVAEPNFQPASNDWPHRMAEAIHKPVAGPSLQQALKQINGGKIVIAVEDLTRHSPLAEILQIVLKEIRCAKVPNERVEILIAGGMHPPADENAVAEKLGPAAEGIAWRWNPWDQPRQYESLGRVGRVNVMLDRGLLNADLRILISSVSPHLQAGFSGGYKMILPGCGEITSIRKLHRYGIRKRNQGQLVGMDPERNPMRRIIDAVGRRMDARRGRTFSVQYLLDNDDKPSVIVAGEPLPAHRMLAKQCAITCGIVPTEPADVLITNAHPRDHDLWQCFKCIPNTLWAARPGGVVICLARCPAGLNEMKTMKWPLSPYMTRKVVRWLGPNTICSMVDRIVKQLAGDSQWFIRMATQLLERNPIYMVSENLVSAGVEFPGIYMFATVEEALKAANKRLGGGVQRLAVYTAGGASYPVCPQPKAAK